MKKKLTDEELLLFSKLIKKWVVNILPRNIIEALSAISNFRTLVGNSDSSKQLFKLADALLHEYGASIKALGFEIYIKAIGENLKSFNCDNLSCEESSRRKYSLAKNIFKLEELLQTELLFREYILISFTLKPTRKLLHVLNTFAKRGRINAGTEITNDSDSDKCWIEENPQCNVFIGPDKNKDRTLMNKELRKFSDQLNCILKTSWKLNHSSNLNDNKKCESYLIERRNQSAEETMKSLSSSENCNDSINSTSKRSGNNLNHLKRKGNKDDSINKKMPFRLITRQDLQLTHVMNQPDNEVQKNNSNPLNDDESKNSEPDYIQEEKTKSYDRKETDKISCSNVHPVVVLRNFMNNPKDPYYHHDEVERKIDKGGGFLISKNNSDISLAKSVPGMSSVDMMRPHLQETTVQVVQISSTSTQSVPSSSISSIQSNLHTRSKPVNSNNINQETIGSNQHEESSRIIHTYSRDIQESQFSNYENFRESLPSGTNTELQPTLMYNNQMVTNRSQVKTHSVGSSTESETRTNTSVISQDVGTQIHTSHIQTIGHPHKQKNQDDSKIQQKDDPKPNSVYTLVVKEEYIDSGLSLPSNSGIETVTQISNQNNFANLLKRNQDFNKTKSTNKPADDLPSLPKFQHVFGRQIYQGVSTDRPQEKCDSHPVSKAVQTGHKEESDITKSDVSAQVGISSGTQCDHVKNSEIERHEIQQQSGVIFSKVPLSMPSNAILQGNPISIIKGNASDVIIPNKLDADKCKGSVIRSNMNVYLTAALQSESKVSTSGQCAQAIKHIKVTNVDGIKSAEILGVQTVGMPTPTPEAKTFRRQPVVQQRFSRPLLQISTGTSMTQTPGLIPVQARAVVLNNNGQGVPTLTKIENRDHLNTEQASVSSTTLEQLREFESVLEQVTNTSQMKERGNANQNKETNIILSESSDYSVSTSKVNNLFQSSIINSIADLNNDRVSLTFITKPNITAISNSGTSTLITANTQKITNTPVVVVQSCGRPLASPGSSATSQSSSSPSSQTSPNSKLTPKANKPKAKSVGKTTPTAALKVSTISKPQPKPQEDEQTTQRIYAILDRYAEQLRNSPELQNKPAPRRRSNPPTNPTQSSKRKKSSQNKSKSVSMPSCSSMEMSPVSEDLRTLGSEDSSNGVSQVSQMPSSPLSRTDEHSNQGPGDLSSEASESLDTKDHRPHRSVADQTPPPSNPNPPPPPVQQNASHQQGRTVLGQDNLQPVINVDGSKVLAGKQVVVGSGGATVPLTLSVPVNAGNLKQVLFPCAQEGRIVVAKGPKMYRVHQVTMPTGTLLFRQMCQNKPNSTGKQVKLPVVSQMTTQTLASISSPQAVVLPPGSQSFTLATNSSLEGDSLGISLDNAIVLNTTASSSTLGFIQRSMSKPGQANTTSVFSTAKASTSHITCHSSYTSADAATNTKSENSLGVQTQISGFSPNSPEIETKHVPTSVSYNPDFKQNKPNEMQFTMSGDNQDKKLVSSSDFLNSSQNKSWNQVLKDVKDIKQEDIAPADPLQSEKNIEKDDKGKVELTVSKTSTDTQTVQVPADIKVKTNSCERNFQFSKATVVQSLPNRKGAPGAQEQQWQFNVAKIEKDGKCPVLSVLQDSKKPQQSSKVVQSNSSESAGLKRKMGENTIFQMAFKRPDRVKVTKDDFMNRNTNLTLERELRLQKSLSEECEDLGVDKPSTSDLFPEAELLLDSDPLSRDSLQEIYSGETESSSNQGTTPSRCSSPLFSNTTPIISYGAWNKKRAANYKLSDLPMSSAHKNTQYQKSGEIPNSSASRNQLLAQMLSSGKRKTPDRVRDHFSTNEKCEENKRYLQSKHELHDIGPSNDLKNQKQDEPTNSQSQMNLNYKNYLSKDKDDSNVPWYMMKSQNNESTAIGVNKTTTTTASAECQTPPNGITIQAENKVKQEPTVRKHKIFKRNEEEEQVRKKNIKEEIYNLSDDDSNSSSSDANSLSQQVNSKGRFSYLNGTKSYRKKTAIEENVKTDKCTSTTKAPTFSIPNRKSATTKSIVKLQKR